MITCARCGTTSADGAAFCGGCGAPLAASPGTVPGSPISAAVMAAPIPAPPAGAPRRAAPLAAGTLVDNKYAIVRVLGEGGMGVVYLARDVHTGLDVVVKAVRAELAHRADVRQRTLAEGRALAQIDHPNVVHLKAVVVDGTGLWLVMQYIDGESLDKTIARYVERGEHMPIEEALAIFRQIASGVGAAHHEGVIHRDLKPANVLLRRKDGVAKVTDFGIAKIGHDSGREVTKGIIGSLWYMSPEQVTGRRDLDRRVDVYALGILLYQMLVGRVPFDAESDYEIMRRHAEAPMPSVLAARPDAPRAVDELIQKACAKSRDQRFQSCEELIAAVDRILARPGRTLDEPVAPATQVGATAAPTDRRTTAAGTTGASAPALASTTGQGAELPAARSHARPIAALLAAVALIGTGVALLLTGVIPVAAHKPAPTATSRVEAGPLASAAPTTQPSSSASAGAPEKSPLAALAGPWISNGKDLDAILVGDVLEFRVRAPAQFAPQDYEAGEARFVLRATAEPSVFTVEDRIRPFPPTGKDYDPRSRGTCQEVWTAASGEPLRARFDGARLSVELAKIEPTTSNFIVAGSKVTSCRGLRDLRAARVVSTLSRP